MGGEIKMNEIYMGKRHSYGYLKRSNTVPFQEKKELIRNKFMALEYLLIKSLNVALEELLRKLGDDHDKLDDTILVINNSYNYLKDKGKAMLTNLSNEIDVKDINIDQLVKVDQKLDAYIRITRRKFENKVIDQQQMERIGVWIRESIRNLKSDLGLEKLPNIIKTQHILVEYNKTSEITASLKKIA